MLSQIIHLNGTTVMAMVGVITKVLEQHRWIISHLNLANGQIWIQMDMVTIPVV